MNEKNSYLSVLAGLLIITGLASVMGCAAGGPAKTGGYYDYLPPSEGAYEIYEAGSRQRITIDDVEAIVKDYLRKLNDPNLRAAEIIEFEQDFYVRFTEKDTGVSAFVALVNPYNGQIYPGHHPDKFWNNKYKGAPWDLPSGPMTVSEEQAWNDAQRFIDKYLPDAIAGGVERFYGYYTIPVLMHGDVAGLVSINGYSGRVCYEACHGSLISRKELR